MVKGIFTIPYIRTAQGPDAIRPSSRGNDPGPSDFIGGPENDLLHLLCAQLERLICWLIVNTLDSECKQFNFLMQQDLANLYAAN